jgi:hypothetical protein
MNRMKTVSPANGTVRAVIFWQGGSDAKNQEDALSWKDRFTALVTDLRADLGNPDLPIVMVMLGDPDAREEISLLASRETKGGRYPFHHELPSASTVAAISRAYLTKSSRVVFDFRGVARSPRRLSGRGVCPNPAKSPPSKPARVRGSFLAAGQDRLLAEIVYSARSAVKG